MATLPWLMNPSYGYGSPYMSPMFMQDWMRAQDDYNPFGGMLKSAAAARYNLQGKDLKPLMNIGGQIEQLARAQVNPDDPLYQRLYEAERGGAMQDLSAAINEMGRQNRKLSMMGRTPLFDPERGGEMIFRQMAQGYQSAQGTARDRARAILGTGQNAMQGVYGNTAQIVEAQDQNKKKRVAGLSNIGDALPLLGKFF